MARKMNITDKLSLAGNPVLIIGEKELEVNADAATMLKIMDKFDGEDGKETTAKDTIEVYNLIFTETAKQEMEKLKLQFDDLQIVINSALALITGEVPAGEEQTHATI